MRARGGDRASDALMRPAASSGPRRAVRIWAWHTRLSAGSGSDSSDSAAMRIWDLTRRVGAAAGIAGHPVTERVFPSVEHVAVPSPCGLFVRICLSFATAP